MLSRPPGLGPVARNGCILCCHLFCYINLDVTFLWVGGGGEGGGGRRVSDQSQTMIKKMTSQRTKPISE